jgi:transcriptional regulator with PAS, ATPase and Fis domain
LLNQNTSLNIEEHNTYPKTLVAQSSELQKLMNLICRIAMYDSTVLITGETGVGKELAANTIHYNSPRREENIIKINCSAIPDNLLESELFGYEPGSFTGALRQGKPGIFEKANNGTILLDEIGDLPLNLQGKLLRVLQENEVMRLGGAKPLKIDVRIIAATNQDLVNLINQKQFREDLYYRLNIIPLNIPPLRGRREDITVLLNYYKEYYERKFKVQITFSPEVYSLLHKYNWPGNIRELRNIVERLFVIMDPKTVVTPDTIIKGGFLRKDIPNLSGNYISVHTIGPLKEAAKELEKLMIEMAMQKLGSVEKVAKVLGINPSTLWRKRTNLKISADK